MINSHVLTRIHLIYYDKRLLKIQIVTSPKFSIADSTSHLTQCQVIEITELVSYSFSI